MLSFYESTTTSMIHMVGDFPMPKRDGHTQCGQPLDNMIPVSREVVRDLSHHRFCIKCTYLVGYDEITGGE